MTLSELTRRVEELEKQLAEMRKKVEHLPDPAPWWVTGAGRFANDPVFDEIVRLGREYRESLHPDRRKKKPKKRK
jgi:hypothetical protein